MSQSVFVPVCVFVCVYVQAIETDMYTRTRQHTLLALAYFPVAHADSEYPQAIFEQLPNMPVNEVAFRVDNNRKKQCDAESSVWIGCRRK